MIKRALALFVLGAACRTAPQTAILSDGDYVALGGSGYRATLDARASRLTISTPDGGQQSLTFTPRPRSEWRGDCATMSSMVLDQTADLAPAPLQLGGLTFTRPMVYAKCGPKRMILTDEGDTEGTHDLIFDHT